ncbi:glyoxalase [Leptospira kobayashii]|uniref:Glyoxalase n=2 Tax=Leptospira kobayashii TaxID=1917830 RepID=A0ABN6KHP9_9LEPT|nr:glyoxalase [Leptospira kobayashii]
MATLKGADFLAIQVKNIEASKKFYTEVLGFRTASFSPPHAVVFDTSPIPFAIREPVVDLSQLKNPGTGIALWFKCDDSVAYCKEIREKGAEIISSPEMGPFGMTFQFKDLDGYILTVHDKP